MPILKKDVLAPVLPDRRVVSVPELNGEVVVRPLKLSDRLALATTLEQLKKDGTLPQFAHIAPLLACCVLDGNDEPLFSAEEWEAWGAANLSAALSLWDQAYELSGLDTTKKSSAPS